MKQIIVREPARALAALILLALLCCMLASCASQYPCGGNKPVKQVNRTACFKRF